MKKVYCPKHWIGLVLSCLLCACATSSVDLPSLAGTSRPSAPPPPPPALGLGAAEIDFNNLPPTGAGSTTATASPFPREASKRAVTPIKQGNKQQEKANYAASKPPPTIYVNEPQQIILLLSPTKTEKELENLLDTKLESSSAASEKPYLSGTSSYAKWMMVKCEVPPNLTCTLRQGVELVQELPVDSQTFQWTFDVMAKELNPSQGAATVQLKIYEAISKQDAVGTLYQDVEPPIKFEVKVRPSPPKSLYQKADDAITAATKFVSDLTALVKGFSALLVALAALWFWKRKQGAKDVA